MNLSKAVARPGDGEATFCIRLPRFSGQASSNRPMLGKLIDLDYTCTEVRSIPYDIQFGVEYFQKTFPFFIRTSVKVDNKVERVARKLDTHFAEMARAYPLLQNLPSLSYNVDDDRDCHFVAVLPPRTEIYSSSDVFFQTLGFGFAPEVRPKLRDMSGGSKRLTAQKVVRGIFNDSWETIQVRGEAVEQGVSIDEMLRPNATMPPTIHIQVQFDQHPLMTMPLPRGEEERQPATRANALRLLALQMDRIREGLALKTNLIEVVPGTADSLYIGNRAYPGANMGLVLSFNPEMSRAFGWEPGQEMHFPLEAARTYEISVKTRQEDPFFGRYPLVVRMAGFGQSISHVDGQGYTSILGYVRGKEQKIVSNEILFDSDCTYVTLQFLDKQQALFKFEDVFQISMLMSFKSI